MDNDLNSGKELIIRNVTIQRADVPDTNISLLKDPSGPAIRREIHFDKTIIPIPEKVWADISTLDLKSPYVDFPSPSGHWFVGLEGDPVHQLCYLFVSKEDRYRVPFHVIQKIFL